MPGTLRLLAETWQPKQRSDRANSGLPAVLLQRLEDHALPGIVRGHFNQRRARDVADDDAIVEIQGARILRSGEGMLDAGLRKQQQLRFDRDVQPARAAPASSLAFPRSQ